MRIYLAGDHAGFLLKEKIKKFLSKHHQIQDFGPLKYNRDDDYPDYTIPLAEAVAKDKVLGIIIAGSGIGETIASNKVRGIRSVLYHGKNTKIIKISKQHDNTNVLCMGSWFIKEKEAKEVISLWIKTKFSEATRHKRRLNKISKYENKR